MTPERFETAIRELELEVLKCDIESERLPLPDGEVDGVVFNELFEHLRINLIFTLTEVRRVMRNNAVLMLSTRNLRLVSGIVNFLFHNRAYSCCRDIYAQYEKLEVLGHMGHVREYTTLEVSDFLGKVGFKVEEIRFRGNYDSRLANLGVSVLPSLRPFVTVVARKV